MTVNASNTICTGKITKIILNSDYNNNLLKFEVNGVITQLNLGCWSDDRQKNVYTLMLSAQMSGKNIQYWGSADCSLIHKNLVLLSDWT